MSNASRFDGKELLCGTGGWFFNNDCLQPETNRYCCDIRLCADTSPPITGTKCVLLLGARALATHTNTTHTLGEVRGTPLIHKHWNIPAIATFLPQDAIDVQGYEKQFNPEAEGYDEKNETGEKKEYLGDKSHSKTARSNWRFWLRADTKRILDITFNRNGIIPKSEFVPQYHISPSCETIIELLSRTRGKDLYFDIETDFTTADMRCFAFSFGPNQDKTVDVYIVPTLDINYQPYYGRLPHIMRALALAFRDNCVVAHNGAVFDFFILAWKYHIAIGRTVFDTMVANHRILPEIEKSLQHCVSYWTWEPFHKSEGNHIYRTPEQAHQLYAYCGKDVYTMFLIKHAQLAYASRAPGLLASINQAMASIRPYLIMSLCGIKYDESARAAWVAENDKLMMQYLRFMRIAHGPKVEPLISNQKCIRYFHDQMGYPVVKRSKKTNRPSLDAQALYKIKLKHENPVIDLLLAYRRKQKETGVLNFTPWVKQT